MKTKKTFPWLTVVPFMILAAIIIIMGFVAGWGTMYAGNNIEALFNQAFNWMVAGLGMVFVTTIGSTDITHGALLCLAGGLGCYAGQAWGVWAMVPVALLVGIASGALLGILNTKFKANTFMMSLALMLAYKGLNGSLFLNKRAVCPEGIKFIDNVWFKIIFLIILFLVVLFVYNYTPFGTYLKGIGENETAMKHVGFNVSKVKFAAFVISGLLCALASVFNSARLGGFDNKAGVSFEMNVMMVMFIGGIPVSGGMKSQLYKIIIGAFTIIILQNGLKVANIEAGYVQLIMGIVLLLSVGFTLFLSRRLSRLNEKAAVNQKNA
ncbi:MAG: ABC transporter permease [Parasporobacterium sp.]|nr:ABC transporter permease [Parasporobacterium sp.]